jgi:hypothetical protein
MIVRGLLAAFLWLLPISGAAWAEEWNVRSIEGGAKVFTMGAWDAPSVGANLRDNALLQTTSDGRILLRRGADRIDLEPSTKLRVEGEDPIDSIARTFEGAVGVGEAWSDGKRFLVMTPQASIQAKGAIFGVVADARAMTVAVQQGLVSVTDLATQKTVDVKEGEFFRVMSGPAGATETPPKSDPASAAAKDAAARIAALGPPERDANQSGDIDPKAVGAIKDGSGEKADSKMAEDAADAVHQEKRKARLGKGDPRAVAAVRQIESDLMEGVDVDAEPLDHDFKWTEVEDGELRLKPLSRIIFGLGRSEALKFWGIWFAACISLGMLTSSLMKDAGVGAGMNTLLIMLAFATAILVRDAFFRAGANLEIEPFLSIGMMLGAMPLLLLGGAFAKMRLD